MPQLFQRGQQEELPDQERQENILTKLRRGDHPTLEGVRFGQVYTSDGADRWTVNGLLFPRAFVLRSQKQEDMLATVTFSKAEDVKRWRLV